MKICITSGVKLPVLLYGGAERVIWDLCEILSSLNHEVYLLAPFGTTCSFSKVIEFNSYERIEELIPPDTDVVHFFSPVPENFDGNFVYTLQGNARFGEVLPKQTVFISRNQARRLSLIHI